MAESDTPSRVAVRIGAGTLVHVLVGGVLVVNAGNLLDAGIHRFGRGKHLYELLALGPEGGIPTWFSTIVLLVAAVATAAVALDERAGSGSQLRHWAGLVVLFTYLSVDEAVQIHERANDVLQRRFGLPEALGNAEVVTTLPLAALVVVAYGRFLRVQPRELRWGLVVAGALYVAGAVGAELVGKAMGAAADGRFASFVLRTVEENLEMVSIVMFIGAVVRELERRDAAFAVAFGPR